MRQHDPDETVRYEVVMAIISAAKKDFNSVTDDLLNFVKERTLDKKVTGNIDFSINTPELKKKYCGIFCYSAFLNHHLCQFLSLGYRH